MADFSIQCPKCNSELQPPIDVWYYTCETCRENLDLKSQYAFLRGLQAFDEGQALMMDKGPRSAHRKVRQNPVYREALDLFTEAYSSLQVAFQGHLYETQRQVGIEMMSSMASEFMKQNMISPLEMTYWNSVLTEHYAQTEVERIKARLAKPLGAFGFLIQTRWNLRLNQLKKKLAEIDQKITRVERQIAFVDIPRARNLRWKP
jgi:hypothetical protein